MTGSILAIGALVLGGLLAFLAAATVYAYRASPRLVHVALLAASYFFLLIYSVTQLIAEEVSAGEVSVLAGSYVLGATGLLRLLWPGWRQLVQGG